MANADRPAEAEIAAPETIELSRELAPLASLRGSADWSAFAGSSAARAMTEADAGILAAHQFEAEWSMPGYSASAACRTEFLVDLSSGGALEDGVYLPNIREVLLCPITQLNNRQRLMAGLLLAELAGVSGRTVYLMEQVTLFYDWLTGRIGQSTLIGSEFIAPDMKSGEVRNGIRHEDAQCLSFPDGSIDIIVSNDVLEHVPDPRQVLREMVRVLGPDGVAIMTFPFDVNAEKSLTRATLQSDGTVHHALPAQYHGNPMSEEGSLVFTDFGWDLLQSAIDAGFRDACLNIHHSIACGNLGLGMVFRFSK